MDCSINARIERSSIRVNLIGNAGMLRKKPIQGRMLLDGDSHMIGNQRGYCRIFSVATP